MWEIFQKKTRSTYVLLTFHIEFSSQIAQIECAWELFNDNVVGNSLVLVATTAIVLTTKMLNDMALVGWFA